MTHEALLKMRLYNPDECDEHGIPLGYDKCLKCNGTGEDRERWNQIIEELDKAHQEDPIANSPATISRPRCPECLGHGSLKALITALRWDYLKGCGYSAVSPHRPYRCEVCNHLMSDGQWANWDRERFPTGEESALMTALGVNLELLFGDKAGDPNPGHDGVVFYSDCDDHCKHRGQGRYERTKGGTWANIGDVTLIDGEQRLLRLGLQAAYRQVDLRPLHWPADMSIDSIVIMCTHCYVLDRPAT